MSIYSSSFWFKRIMRYHNKQEQKKKKKKKNMIEACVRVLLYPNLSNCL